MLTTRPLRFLGVLTSRYPRSALLGCLVLVAVLATGIAGLRIDTDFSHAFPRHDPGLQAFFSLQDHFPDTDRVVLAVEAPDSAETATEADRRQGAIDRLIQRLHTWRYRPDNSPPEPVVGTIVGRLEESQHQDILREIVARSWLWLPSEDLDMLIQRLEPRRVAKRLERGPPADVPPALAPHDPIGLWPRTYLPFWESATEGGSPLVYRDGYLTSREGEAYLLAMFPTRPIKDLPFSITVSSHLEELQTWFRQQPEHQGLELHVASGYLAASQDYDTARIGAITTVIASMVGILILFGVAYRSFRLIGFISAIMLPAVIATLGIAGYLLDGRISLLCTAFGAILIGLGVDAIIHLYNAYCWALKHVDTHGDLRQRRAASARHALMDVGPGIIAGVTTSIGTFLVLMASDFGSLQEFGLISAIGLGVTLILALVALPALLTLIGPGPGQGAGQAQGLRPFARTLLRHPRIFGMCAVLLVGGAVTVLVVNETPLPVQGDLRALRPENDDLMRQMQKAEDYGLHFSSYELLIAGEDERDVLAALGGVLDRMDPLAEPIACTASTTITIGRSPRSLPVTWPHPRPELTARHIVMVDGVECRFDHVDGNVLVDCHRLRPGPPVTVTPDTPMYVSPILQQHDYGMLHAVAPRHQSERLQRIGAELETEELAAVIAGTDSATAARYAPFLDAMRELIRRSESVEPVLLSDIAQTSLAPLLDDIYRVGEDGVTRVRIALPLNHDRNEVPYPELMQRLRMDQLRANHPDVHIGIGGIARIADFIDRVLLWEFLSLTGIALLLTTVLIAIATRHVAYTLLSVSVLAIGIVLTLALMILCGLRWHMMNLAVLPLIIGIGIDNGIHLCHALRGHYKSGAHLLRALSQTGFPILMTGLTTIIGFGSLIFNAYVGVQDLGMVAAIAMAACLFAALVCLPLIALATTHRPRRDERGLPPRSRILPAIKRRKR